MKIKFIQKPTIQHFNGKSIGMCIIEDPNSDNMIKGLTIGSMENEISKETDKRLKKSMSNALKEIEEIGIEVFKNKKD